MVGLAIATIAVMATLNVIDRALPAGIVSFELCAFRDTCDALIAAYRPAALEVGLSLGLDYLFMPLYASALGAAVVFLGAKRGERTRSAASLIAWGAMAAALCDAIEKVALYHMLATGTATAGWVASGTAAIKFGLVAAALIAVPVIALRPKLGA
jgi:hypothetical protein